MKLKLIIAVIAVLAALFLLADPANSFGKDYGEPAEVSQATTTIVYVDKPALTSAQVIWIARLMNCESGINAGAVNPVDLDGTPSNGILQFKIGTFNHFAAKYGITGELMSAESQVSIVTYWILHPGEVIWQNQFPDCVRMYGQPPASL